MRLNITSGIVQRAQKVVIYGPEGIGKTTLASRFPEPLFVDTEAGTQHLDVRRTDAPTSWTMLMETVKAVRDTPGVCRTLVLDTADWAELLCMEHVISASGNPNISSIEGFGYGKGYVYLQEDFGRLLNLLSEVVDRGIHVVITAHAKMRKFEQPDEMGAYDRWEMKLTKQVAPLLKEWCDLLLFCNYKTMVITTGADKHGKGGKNKAQGGKRVMYTSHHACWDAKNRVGLPEELPLDYKPLAPYFDNPAPAVMPAPLPETVAPVAERDMYFYHAESGTYWMIHSGEALPDNLDATDEITKEQYEAGLAVGTEPYQNPVPDMPPYAPASVPADTLPIETNVPEVGTGPAQTQTVTAPPPVPQTPPSAKTALDDFYPLMQMSGIKEEEVQRAIAYRGYFPADTPLSNLPEDFVRGVLIGAWDQVKDMIETMREDEDLPF